MCPSKNETLNTLQKISKLEPSQQKKRLFTLLSSSEKCFGKDSVYTSILQQIATFYYTQDKDYDKAIAYVKKAIVVNSLPKSDINRFYLEANYYNLGRYENQLGHYQTALDNLDKCIAIAKNNLAKTAYLSRAYAQKANIFSKMGDFEKAMSSVDLGINFAKQTKNDEGLAFSLIEKVKTLTMMSQTEKASDNLKEVILLLEKNDPIGYLPYAYYCAGQLFTAQKRYQDAILSYRKSQALYKLKNNTYSYSLNFLEIGFTYYQYLQDYDEALKNYLMALKTMDNAYMKVIIYDDIAAVYWKKKDYPKAFEYYQKALEVAPIGFNPKNVTEIPTVKSLQAADFKSYFLTTLQDKADTWLDYHKATQRKDYLRNALKTYILADQLVDLMRFEHSGTESKLYWRNKTHHLYEQAIETCYLLKNYEKAFYFFEKSKAVLLNDRLNELSAKQQLSAEDLLKEKSLQQKVAELNAKLAGQEIKGSKLTTLQNQLLEAKDEQSAFIKSLELKNPTYYQYKYDTTTASLEDVKKYLKRPTETKNGEISLVEYFVGNEAIYAMKIMPNQAFLQKISIVNYEENSKSFLKYCADNQQANEDFSGFLKVGNQLYQQLFAKLGVPKGRVIIAQDGYFLPFEAMSKSAKRSEYLLKDYALSYTYSVQFLLKNMNNESFSWSNKFFGMAPVTYQKGLNQTELTDSDKSLTKVADYFSFGKTFVNQAANKKNFFENAHNYQIVHLYTHAQADDSDQEPMVYFADSILKLSELGALNRYKTQLLVLSACKTAVGRNATGEGILSLSRGFATLGIPATLTTLWSVENKATYALNELFYQYLSEGLSKDLALQKAKIAFLQSQAGENQLPTFWAGAVLVGDASALSNSNLLWYFVSGILILILAFFVWKKVKHSA
ncbi:CHAT domain-containing protein [Arcicella rosea]|uniref:CHAT domain-containing protein n=1 Tax=Arcicella rosea TaxID=502909 RepID=A0A841EFL7_9BACT|nr:CHAT domain-containing protein [Arcicella rosea]MBB6002092.1 CHAT domain-containing protein [Arcicella rosea]